MKKVIFALLVVATLALFGAAHLYQFVPVPVSNSVIAEKSSKALGGGQVATLLPSNLSEKQHRLLTMAYKVGKENKLPHPEIMQAILLQETLAGGLDSYRVANPGPNAYFGPMQLKLSAARDVLKRDPSLYEKYGFHTRTDDEVKANLILNERFNLEVAAKYLSILVREYGYRGGRLMNAYNRGPTGVKSVGDDYHYAVGAKAKLLKVNRTSGQKIADK
jgi:hypothetical protein